jgi:hypothetical protein
MFGRGISDCCLTPNGYFLAIPWREQAAVDEMKMMSAYLGRIFIVLTRCNNSLCVISLGHIILIKKIIEIKRND